MTGYTIQEPKDLKEFLQLLASLNHVSNTVLKDSVINHLNECLKKYCGSDYLTQFVSNLGSTFTNADHLIGLILQEDSHKYGPYQLCTQSQELARALKEYLPQCYATLYFLYFNTYDKLNSMHGAKWSNHSLTTTSNNPAKWLMGKTDQNLTPGLLPGGFTMELKSSTSKGFDLSRKLSQLVHHSTPASLQKTLAALLFLGPWHDSKLGHAFVFFREFCDQLDSQAEAFQSQFTELRLPGTYDNFKHVCRSVHGTVKRFIDGTEVSTIHGVCHVNTALYPFIDRNMSATQFQAYVLWLKDNLEGLISSLKGMLEDSTQWTPGKLEEASTAGPFRYGFVFSKSWSGQSLHSQLKGPIDKLLQSLPCLLIALLSPLTLRTSLQLCAKLKDLTQLSSTVIQKLHSMVKPYCVDSGQYLTRFGLTSGFGYLYNVFSGANMLLGQMLQSGFDSTNYGLYSKLQDTGHEHCSCAVAIPHYLKDYLPQVFSALYFLYFETDNTMGIASGQWSSHYINHTNQNPGMWLTDQIGKPDQTGLITRGFQQSELKNTQAWGFDSSIKRLLKHDNITSSASLQNALSGLMFVSDRTDPLSGHICVFLLEFCSKVTQTETFMSAFQPRFAGLDWSAFQSACKSLQSSLDKFIGPSSNSGLCAVCWNNTNLYNGVWSADKFPKYIEWLKGKNIIFTLKASLNQMLSESFEWDKDKLKNASTAGPFKYGFVFKTGWTGQHSSIQLKDYISTLVVPLDSLKENIDKVHPMTEDGSGGEQSGSGGSPGVVSREISASGDGGKVLSGPPSTGDGRGSGQEEDTKRKPQRVEEEPDDGQGKKEGYFGPGSVPVSPTTTRGTTIMYAVSALVGLGLVSGIIFKFVH